MRFAFIAAHVRVFPVDLVCKVLIVCRSGFAAWSRRSLSFRMLHRQQLSELILRIHQTSSQPYGSPRVHRELMGQGVACVENAANMSGVGICYGNAVFKSVFSACKREPIYHAQYQSHQKANQSLCVHEGLLQPATSALDARIPQTRRVRGILHINDLVSVRP